MDLPVYLFGCGESLHNLMNFEELKRIPKDIEKLLKICPLPKKLKGQADRIHVLPVATHKSDHSLEINSYRFWHLRTIEGPSEIYESSYTDQKSGVIHSYPGYYEQLTDYEVKVKDLDKII